MLRSAMHLVWLFVGAFALYWAANTSPILAGVILASVGFGGLAGMTGAYFLWSSVGDYEASAVSAQESRENWRKP